MRCGYSYLEIFIQRLFPDSFNDILATDGHWWSISQNDGYYEQSRMESVGNTLLGQHLNGKKLPSKFNTNYRIRFILELLKFDIKIFRHFIFQTILPLIVLR